MKRLLEYPLWCVGVLAGLMFVSSANAVQPLYPNTQNHTYWLNASTGGEQPFPQIDATAFANLNSATFTLNFNAGGTLSSERFFTEDTLFYTNNGTIIANALSPNTAGCSLSFDYYPPPYSVGMMAGTFYNGGYIYADSTVYSGLEGIGRFDVMATNIYNPGTVDVGPNGLMTFTGGGVDLSGSTLTMDPTGVFYSAAALFGLDTNGDWNPGVALTPTTAYSSWGISPYFFILLDLTNSVPYYKEDDQLAASNIVFRSTFLQDTSVGGVTTNVYFDPVDDGFGGAEVEWIGRYQDPASGIVFTNFLYLFNDYLESVATNLMVDQFGLPGNLTLEESPTELFFGVSPSTTAFLSFPNGVVTNRFSYGQIEVIPTSQPTNANALNPSGALTNLPGRLQISASHNLDLNLAQIQGPNYMQLISTNQFDGSAGAFIDVPYSDIYLGVTNAAMTLSNLVPQQIPLWSGTMQAWSTRFINLDTNFPSGTNTITITNDYRVLLVDSSLSPITGPQVDNLWLHATNSLVISDVLNVFGSLYLDAQNLTLTTNGYNNGADSVDGELNWESTIALDASLLPNLLWLTNNGAIRAGGPINLGSPTVPMGAIINNSLISDVGSILYVTNLVSAGTVSNGVGSFFLLSRNTTLTNGSLTAGGNVAIYTGTLITSNLTLLAGNALDLTATNSLTDMDCTNLQYWSVGATGITAGKGIYYQNGFNVSLIPTNPLASDLRHTTVTNYANGVTVNNLWAGQDRGYSVSGYTNNVAVGHLILDGTNLSSYFRFAGTSVNGTTNAMYVDELELRDSATNHPSGYSEFNQLLFSNNLVIYYAQAVINGISVATLMNGANANHLRWLPAYAGVFSSTNLVYPPGVTNTLNEALITDSQGLDSNGNGVGNSSDPEPIFVPAQVGFAIAPTNVPPLKVRLQWNSIPAATNSVLYTTNLVKGNWQILTNFISPTNVPPVAGWPINNVIFDTTSPAQQKFYRVLVNPNTLTEYGY